MAISRIQAASLDDMGGVGDGHEETVEAFQGGKGYGRFFRDPAASAEIGIEEPCGQEIAGTVQSVVACHQKIIGPPMVFRVCIR